MGNHESRWRNSTRPPPIGAVGKRCRSSWVLRCLDSRNKSRPILSSASCCRTHHENGAWHFHRCCLCAQPDDPRQYWLGPPVILTWPIRFGFGKPNQTTHHQALQHGVEPPRSTHARNGVGYSSHLGHLAKRNQVGIPWRLLHAHPHDAILHTKPRRHCCIWSAQNFPRRRGRTHDRSCWRSV